MGPPGRPEHFLGATTAAVRILTMSALPSAPASPRPWSNNNNNNNNGGRYLLVELVLEADGGLSYLEDVRLTVSTGLSQALGEQ